jgi:hypothetical protein
MPDALHGFPKPAEPPRPHPVIDAIIAAGRAAAELRNRHHAEGSNRRRQLAEARAAERAPEGTA